MEGHARRGECGSEVELLWADNPYRQFNRAIKKHTQIAGIKPGPHIFNLGKIFVPYRFTPCEICGSPGHTASRCALAKLEARKDPFGEAARRRDLRDARTSLARKFRTERMSDFERNYSW